MAQKERKEMFDEYLENEAGRHLIKELLNNPPAVKIRPTKKQAINLRCLNTILLLSGTCFIAAAILKMLFNYYPIGVEIILRSCFTIFMITMLYSYARTKGYSEGFGDGCGFTTATASELTSDEMILFKKKVEDIKKEGL